MEVRTLKGKGVGSLSPNYYVSPSIPNKVFTIKHERDSYEIDKMFEDNLDTWILIYGDRTKGWFLDIAEELTRKENSEFVVLMICVNYLEGNQQFREGRTSLKGESTEMLKKSLKRIFPETKEDTLNYFVDKIRHGLFHDGMTRKGVLLKYGLSIPFFTSVIDNKRWIHLDPSIFLKEVQKDFENYIEILKNVNNKKERENFEKHYKERYISPESDSEEEFNHNSL